MPRLLGFHDWVHRNFPSRLEYMNQSQKLTHQGVRDLNGPNANGRGYNGRVSANCPHRRAPDAVAAEMRLEDRLVSGVVRRIAVYYCASCGEKRWEEGESGVELV